VIEGVGVVVAVGSVVIESVPYNYCITTPPSSHPWWVGLQKPTRHLVDLKLDLNPWGCWVVV